MKVPYLDLGRAYKEHRDRYLELIDGAWSSGGFFFGPAVKALEQDLCRMTSRKHAVTVGSCTDALFFSLKALSVGPGDEVIVASFSHVASMSCILRTGATPVFIDIDENNFMMKIDEIEAKIGDRTKAIIAVHMFGDSLDLTAVEELAARYGMTVVEDAAQSFGTSYGSRPVGSLGRFSCLSFDPLKPLASMGYGGAVLTDDEKAAEYIERLRHHGRGQSAEKDSDVLGYNSKMPTVDAEVVRFRLQYFSSEWERRKKLSDIYRQSLSDLQNIKLPGESESCPHLWHKYNILCDRRDQLEAYLTKAGIGTRRCWKMPLYQEGMFGRRHEQLTGVESVCRRLLTLPIYAQMTTEEVEYACGKIREFYSTH